MPELPEVETTRRGIAPHIVGSAVRRVEVRQCRLRWPVADEVQLLPQAGALRAVERRAKYLLLDFASGQLIIHLGMSGSLRIVSRAAPVAKHDHIDLVFAADCVLRYTDPRRFGAFLWQPAGSVHKVLGALGPEPLSSAFDGEHLYRLARGRRISVKSFIMDNAVVVGVGNIYATEALFAAGIRPDRAAGRISRARYIALAEQIKAILTRAIAQGGTTLRDFVGGDGRPGYFRQQLQVYGRAGQPCESCSATLKSLRLGQRASVFCPRCQR